MHDQSSNLNNILFLQRKQSLKVLMDVIIVHDVKASFGLVVFVHVFEDNKSFERLELFVFLELFVDGKVLVKV